MKKSDESNSNSSNKRNLDMCTASYTLFGKYVASKKAWWKCAGALGGSFVQERTVFWVGVTSEKVTVKRSAPAPPVPETTTTTSTTTSTASTPAVSPASEIDLKENAGDVVINVVEAPSGVLKNDTSVVTPEGDSSPSSLSPTSPSTPILTPSEVSTVSSDSSVGEGEEEAEETPLPDITTPKSKPKPKPGPKRKFGLLGRRRTTTTTAAPSTTTTTTTTTSQPKGEEKLSPEVASLERDLINIYDDCGNSKGCFGFPAECETNKKCTMLVTYSKVSSGYKFEIVGSTTTGYVAAGLSDDEKMGGDSVMACLASAGANSGPDVVMAFNNGRNNEMLVEKKYGLSDIQAAVVNGQAYCTFVRDASTEISGIVFDLDKDRFHLMVATGPVNPNGLSYHDKRTVSSGTVALDSFETVEVRSDLFRTLHACFMVGAWICAASCGIIVARYFKKTWLKSRSCGIDQWFHLHRFFMGLTWSLVIAGVVLILYYLNGWKDLDSRNTEHAILGVVSTGLCFIQPFMALCRCSPTHKRRPVFNWLHWFVGNSAQILGIAAIYFGFGLIGAPTWVVFILIIFVAFHCLVHLLLSIGQCISDSRAESSSNVYPMKELNGSRTPLQPSEKNTDAPVSKEAPCSSLPLFVLSFRQCCVFVVNVVV
ncbi:putative ferric-chelate reductase 1 [Portunus trituberculatus]|uniref:Putative ferric-chelate reductase 1 n=1 Tax=Portunus trituberculatus TaxID=210409 RepID=A0A5B7F8E9_PORTR|nr:putative ferric-chelate reductase 1 [Portunus trituberculatus]